MTALYSSGRCKLHGGKSTGAKTPEGKSRQLEGFRRWLAEKRIAGAGAQDEGTQ
nr:HGGxSTG domain-containing protein [Leclercia adecarboxylata]